MVNAYMRNAINNFSWTEAAYYGALVRKSGNLVKRGQAIVKNSKALFETGKILAKSADDVTDIAKVAVKGAKAASKAKSAALGILGVADVAGDLLVKSDVDNSIFTFVPGAGLVEAGAATINACFGTNLLNAKPIWM